MTQAQAAVIMFQQDMMDIMNKVEMTMAENKILDKKLVTIIKKKEANLFEISELIDKAKLLRVKDYEVENEVIDTNEDNARDDSPGDNSETIEAIQDEVRNDESPSEAFLVGDQQSGNEEFGNVDMKELKKEEKMLLDKIKESTNNLDDHHKLLEALEKENGKDENWKAQLSDVERYTVMHHKYKAAKEKKIQAIRKQLRRIEPMKKKVAREKFVINKGASISKDARSVKARFAVKRRLNESVLDCGKVVKKIPHKEKEAMVPKVLKVEESPSPHQCSFTNCGRSFTCPLASHLAKHYIINQEKFYCPFPHCQFVHTQEQLTKHMRSKHTKEQMFTCTHCAVKFYTMEAKVAHEKKHAQQDVWGQCQNQTCLRFYQVARGSCRFCGRH